jgi:hypothetical protein
VVIRHLLPSSLPLSAAAAGIPSVPPAATTFVCTGFDVNHEGRYPPTSFPRSPASVLSDVPTTVSRIHVDYTDDSGTVLLTADVPVTVVPGGQSLALASDLQPPWAAEGSPVRPAYGSLSGALASGSAPSSSSGLTVQIVNDSDYSDEDVYLLFAGQTISVSTTSTQLATSSPGGGTVTATQLSALPQPTPGTITSKYTGRKRNLYQFTLNSVTAGELLVSYVNPVHSTDGSLPSVNSTSDPDFNTRWDHVEITYPGQVDLTSINAYGIPMQVDFLDSQGKVLGTLTYYASTPAILNALYNLNTASMGDVFYNTSGTTGFQSQWVASPPDLSTFTRVLGPNGILSPTQHDPSPYPSFKFYLDSLKGKKFTLTGSAGGGKNDLPAEYTYTGEVKSDGAGGYAVELTGTMQVSPSPWGQPSGQDAGGNSSLLPANLSVSLNLGESELDYNIYSVPATAFTVHDPPAQEGTLIAGSRQVTGLTSTDSLLAGMTVFGGDFVKLGTTIAEVNSPHVVTLSEPAQKSGTTPLVFSVDPFEKYIANSTYATIAGDFFAALNNGYLGGNWGDGYSYADGSPTIPGQSPWWFNPPVSYPFGAARPANDGFYNPYAAVFYNLSDAYAFVYGDRGGRPAPAVEVPTNAAMRITILNDTRLSAPQVSATPVGSSEIDLSWPAVEGATGYSLSVTPPYGGKAKTTTLTSYTLKGLSPGQPYRIKVKATATVVPTPGPTPSPVPIESYESTLRVTTGGTFPTPTPGPSPTPVEFSIACGGWSQGAFPLSLPKSWTWWINGRKYSPSPGSRGQANAAVTGTADQANYYPMVVTDTKGNIVYQGTYAIWLTGSSSSYNIPSLSLTDLLNPLTLSTQPGVPPYSNAATFQAVVGTPLAIRPDKRFSTVVFPRSSP